MWTRAFPYEAPDQGDLQAFVVGRATIGHYNEEDRRSSCASFISADQSRRRYQRMCLRFRPWLLPTQVHEWNT